MISADGSHDVPSFRSLKSVENEAIQEGAGVKVVVRGPRDTMIANYPIAGRKILWWSLQILYES